MIRYLALALAFLPVPVLAQADQKAEHAEPEKVVEEGITGFRLAIDETGAPIDCTITKTSGSAELDAKACELLKSKGKFKPKIGTDGKPMKSEINSRIVWKITE